MIQSMEKSLNSISPISAHYTGVDIATGWSGGKFYLPTGMPGRVVSNTATGVAGQLVVHLVDDPAGKYFPVDVPVGGVSQPCMAFDQIIQAGSTAGLFIAAMRVLV